MRRERKKRARALLYALLVFLHAQPLLLILFPCFFCILFLVPFPSKVCISSFRVVCALLAVGHEWGGKNAEARAVKLAQLLGFAICAGSDDNLENPTAPMFQRH